jgi:hypothetical protein
MSKELKDLGQSLTEEQQQAIFDYTQLMSEKVVPEIVEAVRKREVLGRQAIFREMGLEIEKQK